MRRTRGFTVVEAVVTVALAAVLAGAGAAQLVTLLQGARLAGTARAFAATLRLARGRALAGEGPIEVRLDRTSGTYSVLNGAGATVRTGALPKGVVFSALPARGRIVFRALGTAENATVTLATDRRSRSVVVNQRGRVRVP